MHRLYRVQAGGGQLEQLRQQHTWCDQYIPSVRHGASLRVRCIAQELFFVCGHFKIGSCAAVLEVVKYSWYT